MDVGINTEIGFQFQRHSTSMAPAPKSPCGVRPRRHEAKKIQAMPGFVPCGLGGVIENGFHFQSGERMTMTARFDATSAAAALLADAASLGPVRAILRSCSGFVELFCSTDAFEVRGAWLHVRQPTAHLHVQLPDLASAAFHEAGEDAHPGRPSLWLLGRCGSPCLLLILDQTEGAARQHQETAFAALRTRWGTQVAFRGGDATVAEGRLLH